MSGRFFIAVTLSALAISIFPGKTARAAMPPPKPGPAAEPKTIRQVGFREKLYELVIPPDNPETPAKVALGNALFFDPRLSLDDPVACANCHDRDKGFTYQLKAAMAVQAPRDLSELSGAASAGCSAAKHDQLVYREPCQGKTLDANDPRQRALEAYILA